MPTNVADSRRSAGLSEPLVSLAGSFCPTCKTSLAPVLPQCPVAGCRGELRPAAQYVSQQMFDRLLLRINTHGYALLGAAGMAEEAAEAAINEREAHA